MGNVWALTTYYMLADKQLTSNSTYCSELCAQHAATLAQLSELLARL